MPHNRLKTVMLLASGLSLTGLALPAQASHAPESPLIVSPVNGTTVSSPVQISFNLSAPPPMNSAGKPRDPRAILVIDAPLPAPGSTVTADPQHVAFPRNQTEMSIPLPPGQHQLQVVFVSGKGKVAVFFRPGNPVSVLVN